MHGIRHSGVLNIRVRWPRTKEHSGQYRAEQQVGSSRPSVNAIEKDIGLNAPEERRQHQHLTLMSKIMQGIVVEIRGDLGLGRADNRKLCHQWSTTRQLLRSFILQTSTELNRGRGGLPCIL